MPASPIRQRLRRSGLAGARTASGALLISALAHVALAVTAGTVLRAAARGPVERPQAVEVDLAPPMVMAEDQSAPTLPSASGTRTTESPVVSRPLRPRAAAGRAPATVRSSPRIAGPTGSPAAAAAGVAAANADAPARFVLSAATVAVAGSGGGARWPAAGGSSAGDAREGDGEVVQENGVSVPARLLASQPVIYPAAARQAEIEADLPLEIVVDWAGLVSSARGLSRAGYGLDESALLAIRSYRFSPALRDGRPVRVRMRWTVQFRLH